ncbi:MAG: methyl-accepting chemotaxis protein, partial [Desulfobacterales bacterium]|nr:methyl-accepting chemotaxis protein [Desulfobacterales bacterium]
MNIQKKLLIITLTGIILLGTVSLILAINAIEDMERQSVAELKATMMAEKKEKLTAVVQSAYAILASKYKHAHDRDKLIQSYRNDLGNIVSVAVEAIRAIHGRSDLTAAIKKQMAMGIVRGMRYGPAGKDYLWINDMQPAMVMHPIKPALDGKDLSGFKDPAGKHLFVEMAKVCGENGEGFVEYLWPKPGHEKPVAKISYVKLFKPWNWIIGTGVYVETAESQLMLEAQKDIGQLRYGPAGKDYLWINDMQPAMVMHPIKPALDGKDLSGFKDPNGKHLFVEMTKVCRENGEGFVEYMWPKPGHDKPLPKLSFVKRFAPLDWIVGTGIYLDDVTAAVNAKEALLQDSINRQKIWLISIVAIVAAIFMLLVFLPIKKVTSVLFTTTAMVKDIAEGEGDLTNRLEVDSQDEIGELARWFNVFIEKIQTIVAEVSQNAGQLNNSSTELSDISQQMSTNAGQTASQAETVAAGAEELSVNANSVAAAMEQAATNVGMVTSA